MADIAKELRDMHAMAANSCDPQFNRAILKAAAEIERLRAALEFYRDPFAWKKKHDPEDDVRVPDFYNETCFGDTAEAALNEQKGDQG